MKQINIGYLSTLYHTSHILKSRGGLEQALGAAIGWRLFGTGPAMIEAFGRGELDMGYIGLPPAMIGISRGLLLKCIAGGHVEGTVLVGSPGNKQADSPGEVGAVLARFAGKKIGAPARGSIHDIIIRELLRAHGVAGAEVVNYPWADLMPQAVADGEIAAAAGTPPLAAVGASWYGLQVIIPPRLLWPFNPSYGIVATVAALRERERLEAFVRLHEDACNLIRTAPDEAARIVAGEITVVDAGFIRNVFAVSPHYCSALPQQYRDAAMAFVPVLQNQGLLAGNLARTDVFDLSIISKMHPGPHHY